jgi:hypothetical protein
MNFNYIQVFAVTYSEMLLNSIEKLTAVFLTS